MPWSPYSVLAGSRYWGGGPSFCYVLMQVTYILILEALFDHTMYAVFLVYTEDCSILQSSDTVIILQVCMCQVPVSTSSQRHDTLIKPNLIIKCQRSNKKNWDQQAYCAIFDSYFRDLCLLYLWGFFKIYFSTSLVVCDSHAFWPFGKTRKLCQ